VDIRPILRTLRVLSRLLPARGLGAAEEKSYVVKSSFSRNSTPRFSGVFVYGARDSLRHSHGTK